MQVFSRIAALLTSICKTSKSIESATQPKKGIVGVGSDCKAEHDRNKLDESQLDDNEVDGNEFEDDKIGKKVQKTSKSKNLSKSKKTVRSSDFLIFRAKLAFTKLKQVFFKAPILYYFDLERHIWIKMDILGYAIVRILSQLTSDDLGWWNLVDFFSQRMILTKTRYETHNSEFLAIVEVFKTWKHYLKSFWHEVFILTDHNNLQQFMNIKNLSSKQVRCAQELSYYYFRIDYCPSKANWAANALSQYLQRNTDEEKIFQAENVKILHRLQFFLTNASFSGLSTSAKLLPLHQVFICGSYVLSQLWQFWGNISSKIALDVPYTSIKGMRIWLPELQNNNKEAKTLRAGGFSEGWKDVKRVFWYQGFPYIPEIIRSQVISCHYNDFFAEYFSIDKIRELVG